MISVVAGMFDIHPQTLRLYEREGLLPPPQRTGGEHRRYGQADLDRLLFIRGAQRLWLRLAEIRDLLDRLEGETR
jgi:DNA-binding transcriptional MerR regulator